MLPRLPVVLGLAAVLAVIGTRTSGWLMERISAAGRAAFTNYICLLYTSPSPRDS